MCLILEAGVGVEADLLSDGRSKGYLLDLLGYDYDYDGDVKYVYDEASS